MQVLAPSPRARNASVRPIIRLSVPAVLAVAFAAVTSIESGLARAQEVSSPAPARSSCAAHIAEAAQRFGVPERWVAAVMRQESGGRVGATSHAGAQGCMQIMPATWAELASRHGFGPNAYEPRQNMLAGAAYLRQMYDRYGSAEAMLIAYNAGPGRYEDYVSRGRPLPAETIDYLARVGPAVGVAALPTLVAGTSDTAPNPLAAPLFVRLSGGWPAADVRQDGATVGTGSALSESPFVHSPGLFVAPADTGPATEDARPASSKPAVAEANTVASASSPSASERASDTMFVRLTSAGEPR